MENTNELGKYSLKEPTKTEDNVLIETRSDDIGRFILRLAIGGLMLFHGMYKILYGNEQVYQLIDRAGLPGFISSGVFIGEVVAPLMLILGVWVRLAGFLVAMDMLAAIALVHTAQLTQLGPGGGWMVEVNALYFFGAIAIMFLGSGHIALMKGKDILD